jgi:hypothetical protein
MQQPVGAPQAAINIKLLFQYALRIDPTKRHHPVPLGVRVSFPARRSVGSWEGVVGSMEAIMQNVPWNKRRLTGQKRPLKPKDVWASGSGYS